MFCRRQSLTQSPEPQTLNAGAGSETSRLAFCLRCGAPPRPLRTFAGVVLAFFVLVAPLARPPRPVRAFV